MAAMRSRGHAPIGSAKWILDERDQASQFIEQEVEEFAFSARNEVEWLNEHMTEIFSANQYEVAEVFKTPGKLRGKTPRTNRKHTPAQDRQPLTDIFSSNTPNATASPKNEFYRKIAPFQVAEDKENTVSETSPKRSPLKSPFLPQSLPKSRQPSPQKANTPPLPPRSPLRSASGKKSPSPSRINQLKLQHESRSTGDSFVSAKETFTNRPETLTNRPETLTNRPETLTNRPETLTNRPETLTNRPETTTLQTSTSDKADAHEVVHADDIQSVKPPPKAVIPEGLQARMSHLYSVSATTTAGLEDALEEAERQAPVRAEAPASPSETSSPDRPLIRKKSSLNFASLPARPPLAKKSVGARISHARGSEKDASQRESTWNRHSQAPIQRAVEDSDDENEIGTVTGTDSSVAMGTEASKLHNKTSTQRLHERITMLGKSNAARPSKSIPSATTATPAPPGLQWDETSQPALVEDHDDDWIGPISHNRQTQSTQTSTQQSMPGSFSTNASTWNTQTQNTSIVDSQVSNEPEAVKEAPASPPAPVHSVGPHMNAATALLPASTTPAGSPVVQKWNVDGPLSASKARLNGFFQLAKGMFASSAASSAQAKLETMQPTASKSTINIPATLEQSSMENEPPWPATLAESSDEELDLATPKSPVRRRSSQRLKEKNDTQSVIEAEEEERMEVDERPESHDADDLDMTEDPISGPPKTSAPASNYQQQKSKGLASQSGELRHPAKANKGNKITKPAPAGSKTAVSVRLPSHSQKTAGTFSSSTHAVVSENKAGPSSGASRPATLRKKGSNSSLKSGNAAASKSTAANNARLKALDAAAKSKEREEREKQRKADEKRERERKRAEAEDEKRRKAQEQKAAEQRREREEQEARAAAQRQRREREEQERIKAEKQQAEIQRKNESLRRQAEASKAARATKATEAQMEQEQARPVSRLGENLGGSVRPHVNPAKPKRYYQPEDEERSGRVANAQTPGYATAQNGSKRRKTSEEGVAGPATQQSTRPTMAPPVRPSMARKENPVPNRFTHGYMASTSSMQPGPGGSKAGHASSYAANANQPKTPHHMNDLAKFSSAKIPFADVPNAPGTGQASSSMHPPSRPMSKTPGTAHKSSPTFPNGDAISLPEIATDSEDEDSDDGFVAPDWTQSPELRQLLERQQLVDPMRVFGPIGELKMEEVFKGSKERLAKFRARTSSANWSGPDRLTDEERRKDKEARELLQRDGGWSFRPE